MQRITLRDRSYERNMERDYIDELNRAYEIYFGSKRSGGYRPSVPVLTIDTNHLDFVRNPAHLKLVEDQIRRALKLVPFQSELPLDFFETSSSKQDS